jgi:hypothetical protein
MRDLGSKLLSAEPVPILGGADALAAAVAEAWPRAQAFWSRFLLLGPPVHHPACGSVARIDLSAGSRLTVCGGWWDRTLSG